MSRPRIKRSLAFWALMALVALSYALPTLRRIPSLTTAAPGGYYGALTDAFLSGRLSLKQEPDPALLSLANPYEAHLGVERPHDVSLYKGKFYLYFGATPVVLLYLPWRILTGTWLAQELGTVAFCFLGVLLAALVLRRLKERHMDRLSDGWLALGIATLAWASPTFYLAQNGTFYAVPISCAFFCLMAFAAATERFLSAEGHRRRCQWLAASSLCYGLAISARPDYVFGLPVVFIPVAYVCWRQHGRAGDGGLGGLVAAAVVPAALVGLALGLYNLLRFGNPAEFGMRFALMPQDMRNARLMGTEYLGGNLGLYLFGRLHHLRYFPFLVRTGAFGILGNLPVILVGPAFLMGLPLLRHPRPSTRLAVLCVALACSSAANLFALGLFYFAGEIRYMVDFVPAGLLLGSVACLALATALQAQRTWLRRMGSIVLAGVAAFSLVNGILVVLQATAPEGVESPLARWLDTPVYWIEEAHDTRQGAAELDIEFPTGRTGHREPLISTGLAGHGDILYIEYTAAFQARIGFFHLGVGGPVSDPFFYSPGRHRLRIDMGSLYPPAEHPMLHAYTARQTAALKRRLAVSMDRTPVLDTCALFYDSTPGLVNIGANPIAGDVCEAAFSGTIASVRRLGLPAAVNASEIRGTGGALRLRIRFPKGRSGPGEPLVSAGRPGTGDLFFVTYLGESSLRFGLQNQGTVLTTKPVVVDLEKVHEIELEMGSLYAADASFGSEEEARRTRGRYSVRLDGKLLITAGREFLPSDPADVVCGLNTVGATTTGDMFAGTILAAERIAARAPSKDDAWGPLDALVKFPTAMTGLCEPIACTGVPGKGDVLFVRYEDGSHLRFGLDHWSYGGPTGPLVEVDLKKPHHLQVTMGSFYPPVGDDEWLVHPDAQENVLKSTVRVRLDDKLVFDVRLPTYDTASDYISFWLNSIGASSCRAEFTGQVQTMGRAGWEP